MQKWEYLVVFINDTNFAEADAEADRYADADVYTDRLNQYGDAGWELVNFEWQTNGAKAALKRAV